MRPVYPLVPNSMTLALCFQVHVPLSPAQVVISNYNGRIPLVENEDIQCYNYTLPYQFTNFPEAAAGNKIYIIAIHDFDAIHSSHLFLSIKPLPTDNLNSIEILVRTPWMYTKWNKIIFSLLV